MVVSEKLDKFFTEKMRTVIRGPVVLIIQLSGKLAGAPPGIAAATPREQLLGDITYWFARRDAEGRPRRVWKRVRFFLMRSRGGRFGDRDREMDAVRWFSLDEAEQAAAFENERALVRRARTLLAGV